MKKIYIHIGNFKTASTSLQNFIFINKKLFLKNNIEVLLEKNFGTTTNNMRLFKYFNNLDKSKIKNYFSKISKKKDLLITSEYFSTFSYDTKKLIFLKKILNKIGFRPIIIFYYRCDDSYLYSFYAELMTHRGVIEIDNIFNFVDKIKKFGFYFNIKNRKYFLSLNYYFNNKKILKNWKKIFKKDVYTIKFKKEKNGTLFYKFLNVIGVKKQKKFQVPFKSNQTRKIKFWNIKRLFYLIYLKKMQKVLFDKNDLEI